jgi:lysozyme
MGFGRESVRAILGQDTMKPRHQVSREALELIERFEGYRAKSARLPGGGWTIGYGHTKTAREGVTVSQADAEALLIYDLMEVAAAVNDWTYAPLNQAQFDALCSFALNIGLENFRTSQVLRKVNEGAFLQAACAIDMWRKAEFEGEKIVVDALVRRRAAEKALFLTSADAYAPTPLLPPLVDYEASNLVPRREPAEVRASLDGEVAVAERVAAPEPAPAASESLAPEAPAPEAPEPWTPPTSAPMTEEGAAPWPTFNPDAVRTAEPPVQPIETSWAPPEPQIPAPPVDERPGLDLPAPPEAPPVQDGVLTLTPPPEVASVEPPRPFVEDETLPAAANESEPELFGEDDRPAVAEQASSEFARRVVRPSVMIDDLEPYENGEAPVIHSGMPPAIIWFLGLGVLGLAVFAGGLFFGFRAHGQGSQWIVGLSIGVVGIICVATAVYFLLERLGGREE